MGEPLLLLGLAKKAGLLAVGLESVSASVRAKRARVVLTAADASEGAKRRARGLAEGTALIELPYTKLELGGVAGRGAPGILAITDIGLAAKFAAELARNNPGSFTEAAELLERKNRKAASRKREKHRQ